MALSEYLSSIGESRSAQIGLTLPYEQDRYQNRLSEVHSVLGVSQWQCTGDQRQSSLHRSSSPCQDYQPSAFCSHPLKELVFRDSFEVLMVMN